MEYVWIDEELMFKIKLFGKGYVFQCYKGFGEMNVEQLWEIIMDFEKWILV